MKNLLQLLLVGFFGYCGYTFWKQQHPAQPAPVAEEAAPVPERKEPAASPMKEAAPTPKTAKTGPQPEVAPAPALAKRLAPQGIFYAVQGFSATTDEGVKGVRPGTKVTLVKDNGTSLRVTDGKQAFDVRRELLTDDLDVVARVFAALNAQLVAASQSGTSPTAAIAPAPQQNPTEGRSEMEAAQRRLAMPVLQARENFLNSEVDRIESLINGYQNAANNLRTKQIYVNNRIAGDTHSTEIATLSQKLSTIRAELSSIAVKKAELQR